MSHLVHSVGSPWWRTLKSSQQGNGAGTCTFCLVMLCNVLGRSTHRPSSSIWHSATAAVTGQAGSHDSVPSKGSKVMPNHSSSSPAGRRGLGLVIKDRVSAWEVYLGINQSGDSRSLKGQTWTLGASMTADHPCNKIVNLNRVIKVHFLCLISNSWKMSATSMQRHGKGLEYGRMALFRGSSFFIYKQDIQTYFCIYLRSSSTQKLIAS